MVFGVFMPMLARGNKRPLKGLAIMAQDQLEEEGTGLDGWEVRKWSAELVDLG